MPLSRLLECACCRMSNDSITFLLVNYCSHTLTLAASQSTSCSLVQARTAIPFFVSPVFTAYLFFQSYFQAPSCFSHVHAIAVSTRDLVDHSSPFLFWSCCLHLHQGLSSSVSWFGDHLDAQGEAANGYPKRLMEHTLRHHTTRNQLTRRTQQDTTSESNKKLLFLPYIRGVSEKIERICFPLGVKVISKSRDTLRQSLMKVKATRPEEKQRGVVYEVPYRDCNSVYVGETGRSLEIRLKEHKAIPIWCFVSRINRSWKQTRMVGMKIKKKIINRRCGPANREHHQSTDNQPAIILVVNACILEQFWWSFSL